MDMKKEKPSDLKVDSYMKIAKLWYKDTYLYPLLHRSIIGILLVWIVVIVLQVLFNIYMLPKDSFSYTYPIIENNLLAKNLRIYSLENNQVNDTENNLKQQIINILIKKYVLKRENYTKYDATKLFDYISNTSTKEVFDEFQESYNDRLTTLQDSDEISQDIQIKSIEYISDNEIHVTFQTLMYNKNNLINDEMLLAKVKYDTDSIDTFIKHRRIFEYKVNSYVVDKI